MASSTRAPMGHSFSGDTDGQQKLENISSSPGDCGGSWSRYHRVFGVPIHPDPSLSVIPIYEGNKIMPLSFSLNISFNIYLNAIRAVYVNIIFFWNFELSNGFLVIIRF